jgi:hypothetical protein
VGTGARAGRHIARRAAVWLVAGGLAILALSDAPASSAGVAPPYPPSPVITSLQWHEVVNLGTDNDNWPVTWADDDHVYTAGGDGDGFGGPRGNWICRVLGEPPALAGENITRISTASGAAGTKGSGLLSIDGTLYLWARNADGMGNHAQLGWSTDHGNTWTWGATFTRLGYPTFINFGRDYDGARDGFVYTVSHDDSSAYTPSDRFLLLRVPRESITDAGAWEYFAGTGGSGQPLWSADESERAAVFTHVNGGEGRCARSGIAYHALLGRYLWWQQYPHDGGDVDTRFSGGFGVYDAPEPWGPWTTVYFTPDWDQGPGETGGFCTKYTSTDGETLWLVYSGNDNLRLRRATITFSAPATEVPVAELDRGGLVLERPAPNPTAGPARFGFRLPDRRAVRLSVRDIAGRTVRGLLDRVLPAGRHTAAWDGRAEDGGRTGAGVYFLHLESEGDVRVRRIVRRD